MKLFTINGWPFFTNKDKEKNYLQLEKVRPTFSSCMCHRSFTSLIHSLMPFLLLLLASLYLNSVNHLVKTFYFSTGSLALTLRQRG